MLSVIDNIQFPVYSFAPVPVVVKGYSLLQHPLQTKHISTPNDNCKTLERCNSMQANAFTSQLPFDSLSNLPLFPSETEPGRGFLCTCKQQRA